MGAADDALDAWLAPLVKPRTLVHLERSDAPMAPTAPRFGGTPYLEAGETWPACVCERPLTFICQLPYQGGLFAFYFCFDCFPQDPAPGPWQLRVYAEPRDAKAIAVAQPEGIDVTARCSVRFEDARSLPVWDSAELDKDERRELARAANEDAPWEAFQAACERCAGPQELATALGGYPHWLQGDEAPEGGHLIATIDSEDAARLSWGSCGLVYIYMTPAGPHLILQSL